jgi:hypothetical protein
MSNTIAQRIVWVLWPAFLVAAAAELAFFALFDPADMHLFGVPIEAARETIYAAGFFAFWAVCAASGALTVFLQNSPFEVNRCPLDASGRPVGCPKRIEDVPDDACTPANPAPGR